MVVEGGKMFFLKRCDCLRIGISWSRDVGCATWGRAGGGLDRPIGEIRVLEDSVTLEADELICKTIYIYIFNYFLNLNN